MPSMLYRDRWPVYVAGIAVVCWSVGLGGVIVAGTAGTLGDMSWPDLAIALAYPSVALLCAHVPAARRWSALTLMSALFSALNVASSAWADRRYQAHLPAPGAPWAAWLAGWTWVVSVVGFAAIAYFPDGRLPSPRWRLAPALLAVAGAAAAVGTAFAPSVADYGIASPLPGPHVTTSADGLIAVLGLAGLLGCLACVVVRFRRGGPVQRRQIGWYAYGYAVTLVVLIAAVTTDLPTALFAIGPVAVSIGAGIAILRYRLYDIDRLVNRSLTWGLLSALVVVLYVVSVGFFARLTPHGDSIGGLFATAIVAVAFQPVRAAVQRAVNQIVHGYRDQPEVVFHAIAGALTAAGDDALTLVPDLLASALRLPVVVLDVDGGPDLRAQFRSEPAGSGLAVFDRRASDDGSLQVDGDPPAGLVAAATALSGGTVVQILVRPRRRTLAVGERQLLGNLAPSLAAAAEAVRLRRALEGSRARAVTALAEEQRRMRRDLHDGLGPVLAGLRLSIGSARRMIVADPAAADRILTDAQADAQAAVEDVRRLAHDLRPPSLDELGLVEALRDRLERLVEPACQLAFSSAGVPDPLPAAVEVAAYRIAVEAVLNAVRHARPTRCAVALVGRDGGLALEVADDGVGLPAGAVGHVGLRSMRERAEELGGTIAFEVDAGTAVRAFLPFIPTTRTSP
jgi:signal transduction histidine kinase